VGRLCTICTHVERRAIDAALVVHQAGYRNIAKRYGVDYQAVYWHERNCLHRTFSQSKELQMRLSADHLCEELDRWHERLNEAYVWARRDQSPAKVAALVREARADIESFYKLAHPERAFTPTYRVEIERGKRNEAESDAHEALRRATLATIMADLNGLNSAPIDGEGEEVPATSNGHQHGV
jgi:hypothetical protein